MAFEKFFIEEGKVVRELKVGRRSWRSSIDNIADHSANGHAAWWQSFLRGAKTKPENANIPCGSIRTVDAFCGCGGLSLGASEAAKAVGRRFESVAAIDVDGGALEVHHANFDTKHTLHGSASGLVDFHVSGSHASSRFAYEPEVLNPILASEIGKVDLFLAGPPCQGYSNLNNKTRREDPRNLLYLTAIALAVGLRSRMIVIENVREVVNDKSDVVASAKALLQSSGYAFVDSGVLAAHELGGAQTRQRFFLIASLDNVPKGRLTLESIAADLRREPNTVGWAIGDLVGSAGQYSNKGVMDSVPALSQENRERIDYLFKHDQYDLPNEVRPDCHKNGHTYPSVYGRMRWDEPAQTITTGFLTPGRGRYIHPKLPRVITPHEAARIQAFPDAFRFVVNGTEPSRNMIVKWIGDAVPALLGYAAVLPLVASLKAR